MPLDLAGLSDTLLHEFACRCVEHCLRDRRDLPPFEHTEILQRWVDRKRAWMGGAIQAEELLPPEVPSAGRTSNRLVGLRTSELLVGLALSDATACVRSVAPLATSLYGLRWHDCTGGGRQGVEEACAAEADEAQWQQRALTALRKAQTKG